MKRKRTSKKRRGKNLADIKKKLKIE